MTDTLLQVTEDFGTERDATEALACLTEQDGFYGGRLRAPSPCRLRWGVQAFFYDETDGSAWLPDGVRRVLASFVPRVLGL